MTDEEWVDKIRAGGFDRKQLENLYTNALERSRERIVIAAKEALKAIDPRSYKSRFVKPIRDKIVQITEDIAATEGWAKWEGNKVGNGIKVGGAMISGEEIAESYFSYKHPSWKRASHFCVSQVDEDSAVRYKVMPHNSEEQIVSTSEEAIVLFREAIKV